MTTPSSSSQFEVRDDTREQEGTKPQIPNQQQLLASSSVAPSAPALPQGEQPTTGPIMHAPPTLLEPTLSAADRVRAQQETLRRTMAEAQVQHWMNLPPPNPPGDKVYRKKKDFLKNGIVALQIKDSQIDDGQICPVCLNRYSNDPTYPADLFPLADLGGRVPPNTAGGDDVAYKVLRCGHLCHYKCLQAMKRVTCLSCDTVLCHRGITTWLRDVGKKSSMEDDEPAADLD